MRNPDIFPSLLLLSLFFPRYFSVTSLAPQCRNIVMKLERKLANEPAERKGYLVNKIFQLIFIRISIVSSSSDVLVIYRSFIES